MTRITFLTNPRFWLIGQGVVLLGLSLVLGEFQLFPLDMDGYWMTLKEMEYADLRGILSNVRTFGYPLFLKFALLVSPALWLLPFLHLVVRVLAVSVFYAGLRRLDVRPWLALCIASPLFYVNVIFSRDFCLRVTQVLTDSVGESLLILCVGLLFAVLGSRRRVWTWMAFTAALFLTYQVRPLYQFMVVLFPLLGWAILGITSARPDGRLRWRVTGDLAAACLLPFLAWCTFRLLIVGHFGLVSFTGSTLGGIAGQILTEEVLADLPEAQQPFARAVLERRAALISGKLKPQFGPWTPAFDEHGQLVPGIVDDDDVYLFAQIDLFQATAGQFHGHDYVARDRTQLQAALAIFRARPWHYAQWCFAAWRGAPEKVIWYNVVLLWMLAPLGLLGVIALLLALFRCVRAGPRATLDRARTQRTGLRELKVMLAVALPILFVQVLLTGAMIAFLPRYYDSPGVFLPSVVVVGMVYLLGQIRAFVPGFQGAESQPS